MSKHKEFKVGDTVWYASLGDGVKFKIIDRCVSGELVLGVVESAYQYDGGWPIGRLMLADTSMLRLVNESECAVTEDDVRRIVREELLKLEKV